jgi:hypothetical protein
MRHIARLLGSTAVLWDGGGGGAGGGAPAGGGDGGWKAPEGLPAEYAGKTADETLGKLLPAFTEARTRADGLHGELARVPRAPEKPELYTYKPSEKLAPFFGDVATNPALGHARAAAHKAGISDAAFGALIEGTYGPMLEAGLILPPYDPKAEIQNYMKLSGVDQTAAAAQFAEAEAFAKGLGAQLKLPAEAATGVTAALVALTDTAEGNILLRALSARLAENGIRIAADSTGTQQGAMTKEEAERLSSDPRIDPANREAADPAKRFDPVLRQRYDDYFKTAPVRPKAF